MGYRCACSILHIEATQPVARLRVSTEIRCITASRSMSEEEMVRCHRILCQCTEELWLILPRGSHVTEKERSEGSVGSSMLSRWSKTHCTLPEHGHQDMDGKVLGRILICTNVHMDGSDVEARRLGVAAMRPLQDSRNKLSTTNNNLQHRHSRAHPVHAARSRIHMPIMACPMNKTSWTPGAAQKTSLMLQHAQHLESIRARG